MSASVEMSRVSETDDEKVQTRDVKQQMDPTHAELADETQVEVPLTERKGHKAWIDHQVTRLPGNKVDQQVTRLADKTIEFKPAPPLPKPDAERDWHLLEHMPGTTKYYLEMLQDKREILRKEKYIFCKAEEMKGMLRALGATDNGLTELERISFNLNPDATLNFRETAHYRLIVDYGKRIMHRARREPFILTTEDGFVREDSGVHRFFGEAQAWMMMNDAWQALARFKFYMMEGTESQVRPGCDPEGNWNHHGFFVRIKTTKDLLGEPASEGVHQDGTQFTMTTFFHSENMREDSAKSSLYTIEQEPGVQEEDADPAYKIATVQHREFLDTLLFVDNEIQHAVTPLYQEDKEAGDAVRDMGIFFTRQLYKPGQGVATDGCDKTEMHAKLPFAASIDTPALATLASQRVG